MDAHEVKLEIYSSTYSGTVPLGQTGANYLVLTTGVAYFSGSTIAIHRPGKYVLKATVNLLKNGLFGATTGWTTAGTTWTIGSEVANHATGSSVSLNSDYAPISGHSYKLSWTIPSYTSGYLFPYIGGVSMGMQGSNGSFTSVDVTA